MPAFQPATTFARNADYDLIGGYLYSRNGSPNVSHVEALMAELEEGAASLFFASGMAAVAAVIDTLDTGQRVSAPDIMYHGVKTWLLRQQSKRGIGLDLFDVTDGEALARSITPGKTAIVWIETPVNPTWDIVDIAAAAEAAHRAGAILVVDSTCAPPPTTRPLELGADIVFHSATKYLNGHSDVTAGVLTARAVNERWNEIGELRVSLGSILAPFEAWLLLRGLRTLYVRFRPGIGQCARHRPAFRAASENRTRALSGPRSPSGPQDRGEADAGGLRRHDVDPRQGWRSRGQGRCRPAARCSCRRLRSAASRASPSTAGRSKVRTASCRKT